MENVPFADVNEKKRLYCLELAAQTLGPTMAGKTLTSAADVTKAAEQFLNFVQTGDPLTKRDK